MTADRDDKPDGDVLASLATLRTRDVSQHRSRQLRRRCHATLRAEASAERLSGMVARSFPRDVAAALGSAWCFAYVVAIVRFTATIYGYLGLW